MLNIFQGDRDSLYNGIIPVLKLGTDRGRGPRPLFDRSNSAQSDVALIDITINFRIADCTFVSVNIIVNDKQR